MWEKGEVKRKKGEKGRKNRVEEGGEEASDLTLPGQEKGNGS